jgi:prolyl-tRNA editing enzyme YbaK/EbsC (Cys-tRNA(Pro) deacylase)
MEQPELQVGETAATKKILEHLNGLGVSYQKLEHEPVTTSEAAAGARASRLEQGAKALIVKSEDKYYHLIISAAKRVDNNKLRRILGTRRVRFATPDEVRNLTGCLPGAVPPFGNLFGLRVLMDDALMAEDEVYFNCGSHTISLRMKREDLVRGTGAETQNFHAE